MSRRLRLALFLAALAATAPMPSAHVVEATRVHVSMAWLRSERAAHRAIQPSNTAVQTDTSAHRGFHAHPAPVVSAALLPYSLFQRPPPFEF